MKGNVSINKNGGSAEEEYIKCHRTTIEIQTPAWENQPIIKPPVITITTSKGNTISSSNIDYQTIDTIPFIVISDITPEGVSPAVVYIENKTALEQIQAGDNLLWQNALELTADDLRANVYDTISTVTVDGTDALLPDFKPWTDACYFVTLKNTDGTALESGQFKLCAAPDGYATALNQVFCLPDLDVGGGKIGENSAVDFFEISDDRRSFTMRTAGQRAIKFTAKNPLMSKYNLHFVGHCVEENAKHGRILYFGDSVMGRYKNGKTYSFYEYAAGNGCLFQVTTSSALPTPSEKNGKVPMGFEIDYTRAKNGANVSFSMLLNFINKPRDNALFLTNDNSVDLTAESIDEITISDMGVMATNGSTIVLEEIG